MKLTITEVTIHRTEESPVFGELATHVRLYDEGAGPFIQVTQTYEDKENEIRLEFAEIEYLIAAIEIVKRGSH
jgi:hypothetical protein